MVKNRLQNLSKSVTSNTLLKGSMLVFVASFGSSVVNYFYHFAMGRLLSPADYAVLFSLISLTYFSGVIGTVIQTSVTKIVSEIKAFGEERYLKEVLVGVYKQIFPIALFVLALLFVFRNSIAGFLHTEGQLNLLPFFGLVVLSFFSVVPNSFFQGLLEFTKFSALSLLQSLTKLALSVGFILAGFGLVGSLWGWVVAILLGVGVSTLILYKLVSKQDEVVLEDFEKEDIAPAREDISKYISRIWGFSLPALLTGLGLVAFHNTDVLLVKHFFSATEAGRYSSGMLMGRMIFFAASSIPVALFPISSITHASGGDSKKQFKFSLLLTLAVVIAGFIAYSTFPTLIVNLLFGKAYLGAVPLMQWFAVFMGLYALVNLFVVQFLATRRTKVFIPLLGGALVQLTILFFNHNSLLQVLQINSLCALGVLFMLIVWYSKENVISHNSRL